MPLERIRAVLAAPDPATRNALIALHLDALQGTLAQTQAAVASLRDLLEGAPEGQSLSVTHTSVEATPAASSPDFRSRAGETLCLFMTVLLIAVLLAIPDQRRWELGVELVVLALALGSGLYWLDRVATASPSTQSISRVLAVLSPRTITTSLLALAGLLLVVGVDQGLYVVVPSVIAAMTGGVASAWLFLTRITA